ncbi:MMPL family transporter [Nocardia sp. NPDC057353]|uniref:MMPL family transporter n=1 Tax=Nocardia sp. NPDC057353 TaxID=3346104 RepID=UPI0036433C15
MTVNPKPSVSATVEPPPRLTLLGRWGRAMARHRWLVLGVWVVLALAGGIAYPSLEQRLQAPDLTVDDSEATVAGDLIGEHFAALGVEQNVIVFSSAQRTVDDPEYRAAVDGALATASASADVRVLTRPYEQAEQVSADRRSAFAVIGIDGDMSARAEVAERLQRDLAGIGGGEITVETTGFSAVQNDIIAVEKADTVRAELVGVPIALVLLLLATSAFVAALVPVAMAGAGVLLSLGMLYLCSAAIPVDPLMISVATMIGTGVGIDYALIVVSRFREELAGAEPERAVAIALETAGKTVVASGVIVLVALCSLIVVPAGIFRGTALSVTAALVSSVLVALTLLPALLAALGPRIDRGRLRRTAVDRTEERWSRWARAVMRKPVLAGTAALLLLGLCAWPLTTIRYGNDTGVSQIQSTPSGHAAQVLTDEFGPGLLAPIQLAAVGKGGGPLAAQAVTALDALAAETGRDERVASVLPVRAGGALLLSVVPSVATDSTEAAELVRELRGRAGAIGESTYSIVAVGGTTAAFVELSDLITGRFALVVACVLAFSFVLLVAVFRSVLLPIKAIAMNLAVTAAALGLTVAVFQWGHGEQVLDFTGRGYIQAFLPATVFVVLFGLSMDYEVFLIRRIREHWLGSDRSDRANDEAVVAGIARTARAITVAAAIMVVVFGAFATARVLEIKQLGFALAVAIALDAVVVRMLLVPAFMKLLGRWNWWLPRLRS